MAWSPERFRRAEELFHEVVDLEEPARSERLAELTASDSALRAEVERLLEVESADNPIATGRVHELGSYIPSERDQQPTFGEAIGPYLPTRLLGEGGMGQVLEAEQESPVRRTVALKIIRGGSNTENVLARFQAEQQALARMDHPHIARIYDAGITEDGRPYFAMERVDGVPVDRFCDDHRLEIGDRLEIFLDICDAVRHAHRRGVIHRDLKPSNLLVSERGGKPHVKVIDFGIAKAVENPLSGETFLTRAGEVVGTPEYMSPEQAAAKPEAVDVRSDVFSLGIVLYELLTGARPFEAEAESLDVRRLILEHEPARPSTRVTTSVATASAVADRRRTNPAALSRTLRDDLDWIVLKALAKLPDERYESVSEVAADIRRHLANEPILAGPPSTAYRLRKFWRRHRALAAASAVGAAAMLVGLAGLVVGFWESRRSAASARLEAARAEASTDFLIDLFQIADPTFDNPKDLTAPDILARGSERLEQELADQPLVRARLAQKIGTVYRNLGMYEESRTKLEEAMAIWDTDPVAHRAQRVEGLLELGKTRVQLSRPEDALALFEESAALAEEQSDTLGHLRAQAEIADTVRFQGQYQEALDLARAALGRIDSNPSLDQEAVLINLLSTEADCLLYLGKFDEAGEAWQAVLNRLEARDGPDHPSLADPVAKLATVNKAKGRHADSVAPAQRALKLSKKRFGERHPQVARRLRDLGESLRLTERHDEAEPHLREALAMSREFHSSPSAALAANAYELALLLMDDGRPAEARPLILETVEIEKELYGTDHSNLGVTYVGLTIAERRIGDWAASRAAGREAVRILEATLPPEHWLRALPMMEMATTSIAAGDFDRAEGEAERARAHWAMTLGESHEYYLEATANYIESLLLQGDVERAEPLLRQTLEVALAETGETGRITVRLGEMRRRFFTAS